jgi:hypothetical protein
MDELFTYIKKNQEQQKTEEPKLIVIKGYGLLLTGIKGE